MKKTFAFDFQKGEFIFKGKDASVLTGLEALKQWIRKTLLTQRGRYKIYTADYGANIEDLLIGKNLPFEYIETELKREIESALLRHEDIKSITNFKVQRNGSELIVSFTLETVYGTTSEVISYDDR